MNIHEHQAKKILKNFGAPVSKGVVIFSLDEIDKKIKELNSKNFVLKAQIHAGGRGKGGGVKLVKSVDELKEQAKIMFGMNLITHQTGPEGKEVKRLYVEEASDILKEFYLSCLVDRGSSKIAFIKTSQQSESQRSSARTDEKWQAKLCLGRSSLRSQSVCICRSFYCNWLRYSIMAGW